MNNQEKELYLHEMAQTYPIIEVSPNVAYFMVFLPQMHVHPIGEHFLLLINP
jgi:hypothetical protein